MRPVFLLCFQLLVPTVAVRPHQIDEETSTIFEPEIEKCDLSCEPRPDARHPGEFLLESTKSSGISGISGHVSDYYVSSGKCGDGPRGQRVSVVPHFEEEDPVNKSTLLISVEPRELNAMGKAGAKLHLCADIIGKDQCLCRWGFCCLRWWSCL